jgi:hypothetical protein
VLLTGNQLYKNYTAPVFNALGIFLHSLKFPISPTSLDLYKYIDFPFLQNLWALMPSTEAERVKDSQHKLDLLASFSLSKTYLHGDTAVIISIGG